MYPKQSVLLPEFANGGIDSCGRSLSLARAQVRRHTGTYRTRLDNLLQRQVHPGIALDQMTVERLAVLQLDQHGVALGRIQQA